MNREELLAMELGKELDIQAMKDMGAKVSTREGTIVIDLRHPEKRR